MFETIATWTPILIPTFLLLDLVVQRRRYEKPRFWRIRALAVTVAIVLFSGELAVFWSQLLGDYTLLDLSGLGTIAGAVFGIFVYELFHYVYHRSVHEVSWLWRHFGHQMHHSAESLDAWGAHYLHPVDAAMFTTGASLVFVPLLGLTTEATILGALFLTFNAMFQHANIATPHWLGYLIQRPESHNIHHERGVHAYNYSDLPIIDMLFGTFRNPRALDDTACGFYPGASSRIPEMLIGRDVSQPSAPPALPAIREAA
ncbi:MAG: sterol desaturase family protein [Gammaproteobacteria bacterium]|nr:sterol desaturase family protein [Gammaproteobacteria bacterium]